MTHRDNGPRFIVAGYPGVLGVWAFIPGIIGLWRLFEGPRRITLGQVGAGLMLIGLVTTIAFFGFGIYEYEAAQSGYDAVQMAKLADNVEAPSAAAIPLLIVFLVGVVVGSFIVAWSLWRRHVVPVWSPVAIVIGTILNFLADNPALSATAWAFTLVGFGWVGVRLLSMSADDWNRRGRVSDLPPRICRQTRTRIKLRCLRPRDGTHTCPSVRECPLSGTGCCVEVAMSKARCPPMGDAAATGARETLKQLTSAIDSHLGSGLLGLYLFGSLAAGGFYPGKSDLDLMAIVAAEVEEGQQLESLRSLHDAFVSDGPHGSSALRSHTWIAGCCERSVIARAAASP